MEDAIGEHCPGRGIHRLFSKEDICFKWKDIEEHADETGMKNWRVTNIVFEGSGHYAHLMMDGGYIKAIKRVWEGD